MRSSGRRALALAGGLVLALSLSFPVGCGGHGDPGGGTEAPAPPAAPDATITADAAVVVGTGAHAASVKAQPGCTYAWTADGGAVASGQGTASITWTADQPGTLRLGCTVTASDGRKDLRAADVAVLPPPDASITAEDTVVTGSAGHTASVHDDPHCTYAWTLSGPGTLTSGPDKAAVTYSAGSSGTLTLTCTMTAPGGVKDTRAASVRVVPPGPGLVTVRFRAHPSDIYARVDLDLQRVELHAAEGGWLTLATPAKVVNAMGTTLTLASGVAVPQGRYDRLRLVLGPQDSATWTDLAATVRPLGLPDAVASGVEMPVDLSATSATRAEFWIVLDPDRSIQEQTGTSLPWQLYPYVEAVDKARTGTITGYLQHDGNNPDGTPHHHPMYGAIVYAETFDADGVPHLVRAVRAGTGDGRYALDLLPLDVPLHVVSMPLEVDHSHSARASDPITLTAAAPTAVWDNLNFFSEDTSNMAVDVGPLAKPGQSDVVYYLTPIKTPSGATKDFIVHYRADGIRGTEERADQPFLNLGTYKVHVERHAWSQGLAAPARAATSGPVAVVAQKTTYVTVIYP